VGIELEQALDGLSALSQAFQAFDGEASGLESTYSSDQRHR
jgi:hypothetical protein